MHDTLTPLAFVLASTLFDYNTVFSAHTFWRKPVYYFLYKLMVSWLKLGLVLHITLYHDLFSSHAPIRSWEISRIELEASATCFHVWPGMPHLLIYVSSVSLFFSVKDFKKLYTYNKYFHTVKWTLRKYGPLYFNSELFG